MVTPLKVLVIYGTRPEAIKLAPVVLALRDSARLAPVVCVTAQHREMLDEVNSMFGIVPNYDLDLMQKDQALAALTARAIEGISGVLETVKPEAVVVQGDTTTAMCGALSSFYQRTPVAHVEAGLRTGHIYAPFPEEVNRAIIGRLAMWHFAPTERARRNLVGEGIDPASILVTGNTAIDAVLTVQASRGEDAKETSDRERVVLLTAHRRESFGEGLRDVCEAVRAAVHRWTDLRVIYPVHPNPNVASVATRELHDCERVDLVAPLGYRDFVRLLDRAWLVLTDSGGIQEEAPALHKPVLVLRDVTERPEAVESGTAKLVGTDPASILAAIERLYDDPAEYARMARAPNPFGDGQAGTRIVARLTADLTSGAFSRPAG